MSEAPLQGDSPSLYVYRPGMCVAKQEVVIGRLCSALDDTPKPGVWGGGFGVCGNWIELAGVDRPDHAARGRRRAP